MGINFLHNYNPEPIAYSIGFLDIYWYGIVIASAVIVGLLLITKFAKKRNIDVDHIYNLLFILLISSLVGGRIGHIIGEWDYYVENLNELVKIWHGGLAIQGIIIMDLFVVYIYGRIKKINFLVFTDLIVVALPLMQSIGRWGNYFNQELFGLPTNVIWGLPIEISRRPEDYINENFFHPVFLYESILMLVVFCIMLYLFHNKTSWSVGKLTLVYFIMFPIVRFSLDFIKVDLLEIGPLLLTQWISILLFLGAAFYLLKLKKNNLV